MCAADGGEERAGAREREIKDPPQPGNPLLVRRRSARDGTMTIFCSSLSLWRCTASCSAAQRQNLIRLAFPFWPAPQMTQGNPAATMVASMSVMVSASREMGTHTSVMWT